MKTGFTLIELLVGIAIVLILLSLSVVSLTQVQQHSYVSKSREILLSDIKLQQTKAMNGYTDTASTVRHGVHFEETSYTLFHGDTYSSSDPTNFTVTLDGQLSFTAIGFASSEIVFEKGSGEILNFVDGSNSIVIANPGSTEETIITLNKYGAFTEIN